jgi:hypothetical protein
MLLIYAHITSARLQYITQFIFASLHGCNCRITIDSEAFKNHDGPKINYSDTLVAGNELWIKNVPLLFEDGIHPQSINCFELNGHKAFFKTEGGYPFDVFAAAFYLLSRYEEYLPHVKDSYGRYAHENALAFKEDFLQLPLINIWAQQLALAIKEIFPAYTVKNAGFQFVPTYDIDTAYSYLYKGFWRNFGRVLRLPHTFFERIAVLAGRKKDPFDCYDWLHQLHSKYQVQLSPAGEDTSQGESAVVGVPTGSNEQGASAVVGVLTGSNEQGETKLNIHPVYFFLVAEKSGPYDKNILPHKDAMWRLVKKHASKYSIGLHPSWQSGDKAHLLPAEKKQLEAMAEQSVTRTRQHYIRFNLPDDYARLIDNGLTDDYSMGYGSINGFRASVATPFNWYNLPADEPTSLLVHPFCYMEANGYYEQKMTPAEALTEMTHYLDICKKVNGTLCTIWHNNFLGTDPVFRGWKEVYERFWGMV